NSIFTGALLFFSLDSYTTSNSSSATTGKQQQQQHDTMMIKYSSTSSPHTRWPVCSQLVAGHTNGRHVARSTGKPTPHQFSAQIQQPQLNSTPMRLCNNAGLVKRRLLSRVECFLSSDPVTSGWQKPKNLTGLDTAGVLQPEYRAPVRKQRGDCRAEQYEMTGAPMGDVPAEAAVLVGDANNPEAVSSPAWWQQFPKRMTIVVLCFFSFLLCNMDRVNMSIAILPMSAEFGWSPATVGLIQSSFFWGYLLTQILGGIWADRFGGKVVLGFGVVWWSIATILTPFAAKLGLPFLLVVRAFMGIGEGVAMPAMNNILSKWIPVSERSRSLALVYSGMYLGSVTGLAFSPFLISKFGWPSVFYGFGSLGSIWFTLWQLKLCK
uniref:Major facilitator superfamily (MFS) profile domain-containing protein n=1 Tax=Aegilops tauschii subsp. strangulata TaxID=200361 RepID=A0A453GY37_AEGTS